MGYSQEQYSKKNARGKRGKIRTNDAKTTANAVLWNLKDLSIILSETRRYFAKFVQYTNFVSENDPVQDAIYLQTF